MYGKEDIIKKVIVTDLDSKDKTLNTLKNFQKENEYEFINVSTWRKCKDIIDMIDEE